MGVRLLFALALIASAVQAQTITRCPRTEQTQTHADGTRFAICTQTDYQGTSTRIIGNSGSMANCLAACQQDAACQRAVYDNQNTACHIKGAANQLTWVRNTRFNTIRVVSRPVAPTLGAAQAGQWSAPIQFPIIPVAAYIVPKEPSAERLLVFSSHSDRAFSGPTGITQFADYNFVTGSVSRRVVQETKHDMFCPGMSSLADGKMIVSGGSDAAVVSIYDPNTNQFTRAADMTAGRGYQTSVTISDGRVFTIGGSFTGAIGGSTKNGEIYDPATNRWTRLPGANVRPLLTVDREGSWRTDNHAWLYAWKNGSVFQGGPSRAMNWYYTSGTGAVAPAGNRGSAIDQMCGITVMYDALAGKILSVGGSQDYTDSDATRDARIITITDPGVAASVEKVSDAIFARGLGNGVVLPSGHVILTGGQRRSLVFTDVNSVFAAESFDPVTKRFTQLASAQIPRNYHAVSILLPDGTVFVGGGGMCPAAQGANLDWCDRAKDHFDGEIFFPPYLFNPDNTRATRPAITGVSNTKPRVGDTVTATLQGTGAATFALVRMGSVTHSVNSDQRRVPLTNVQSTGGSHAIVLPRDSGILTPGPWYLFAMQNGVPSIARTVYVSN